MQCSCGATMSERVGSGIPFKFCEYCGRAEIPPALRALNAAASKPIITDAAIKNPAVWQDSGDGQGNIDLPWD